MSKKREDSSGIDQQWETVVGFKDVKIVDLWFCQELYKNAGVGDFCNLQTWDDLTI